MYTIPIWVAVLISPLVIYVCMYVGTKAVLDAINSYLTKRVRKYKPNKNQENGKSEKN